MTNKNNKPELDEQSFDKLLEAAYVLQEHNRKAREVEQSLESRSEQLREQELEHQAHAPKNNVATDEPSPSNGDYTLILAEIVEAQRQIQIQHLGLDDAMAVVTDRLARITNASGAAVGIVEGKTVRYRAGAGASTLPAGSERPLDRAICAASVRTGKVVRSEDVSTEFLFDPELCRERHILSLLAVPIYRDGEIVGALELYFDRIHGFAEQDIHTCQLMAGLVTEAISRDAELTLRKSVTEGQSVMLAASQKLKPDPAARAENPPAPANRAHMAAGMARPSSIPCWKCKNDVLAEELFCGTCGAPRSSDDKPSGMQRKFASALYMHQASAEGTTAAPANGRVPGGDARRCATPGHKSEVDSQEDEVAPPRQGPFSTPHAEEHSQSATSTNGFADERLVDVSSDEAEHDTVPNHSTALVVPQADVVWSSAANARDFLESVSGPRTQGALARFWRSRRGDFYLVVALILVVVVIRWGIWFDHSGAAGPGVPGISHRRKVDPNADLSMFDRLLISLGLAEAPDAPEYKGNPEAQVWVDLNTALYYCPGSDLYGKTAKGKLSSQRDAQLDQFEPANRKVCD